jgi:hypothetical protein
MARNLMAHKHVSVPPHQNVVPMESRSNGQFTGYFLRTLWTLLQLLGYGEPPLFVRILRLL